VEHFRDFEKAPLAGRALDNVVALCELAGLVRYFHPSDEAAMIRWDRLVADALAAVEGAADAQALSARLAGAFAAVAPSVETFAGKKDAAQKGAAPAGKKAAAKAVAGKAVAKAVAGKAVAGTVRWHHHGPSNTGPFNYFIASDRVVDTAGDASACPPYVAELAGGVSCRVPVALPLSASRTSPPGTASLEPAGVTDMAIDERRVRLAIICLAWNALRYFFPYQDVVAIDWQTVLGAALAQAAECASEQEFYETLCRLAAAVHDGHARVYHPTHDDALVYAPPISWDWIEGRLTITGVRRTGAVGFTMRTEMTAGISPGDVVLSVDGVPVDEAISRASALVSGGTPQWVRLRAMERLISGQKEEPLVLTLERPGGAPQVVTLYKSFLLWGAPFKKTVSEPRPDKIARLKDGIWYVDLTRVTTGEFDGALADLSNARGVVFDVRGYPPPSDLDLKFLGHFIDKPAVSAHCLTPVVESPNGGAATYLWQHTVFEPKAPRLKAKAAFMLDARAISYAESLLQMVENYKLGELVGQPTAGCNGALIFLNLPGGYVLTWTGMRVLKHDGSHVQGVGVLPTIAVEPTVAGVRAGKDEVLERALAAVDV